MQGMLLNQMQHKQQAPSPQEVDNQLQTQTLMGELMKKKSRVVDLEKENRQLAEEYLKAKAGSDSAKPARVLEEMVKDKNQVAR